MLSRNEALSQVEQIRLQLARAEIFGAFRSLTTAATGVLALLGGIVQSLWNLNQGLPFVLLWVAVATASLLLIAAEMTFRYRRTASTLQRDNMIAAAGNFLPCIAAGGLVAFALAYCAPPDEFRLLPGLWSILFALGMVAARPGLPRAANLIVGYYLLIGVALIALHGYHSPVWAGSMPLSFGIGQLLSALMLARQNRNQPAAA